MKAWLTGKKTYLLGGVLVVALAALVFLGKLTPGLAIDILAFAAPAFAMTFRDALAKNHQQVLAVLDEIAQAGIDAKGHNTAALVADGEKIVTAALPIVASGVNISFSGEPASVVAAVGALQSGVR